jgi:hypothetical protein
MKTSENIDQLATALAAAQAEMPPATFNKTNPHFKNQYADLASIREATLPALTKNGLSIIQTPSLVVDGVVLFTRLLHKSGQWIEGEYPITLGSPQSMGSQLTYARRYSWSSITGIVADDDDDAEVAEASLGVKPAGPKKSAYRARKDGDWESIKAEMDAITNAHALKIWALANSERLHSLPDNWLVHFREEYKGRLTELQDGVTETGSQIKEQLKTSLLLDDEIPKEGGGNET